MPCPVIELGAIEPFIAAAGNVAALQGNEERAVGLMIAERRESIWLRVRARHAVPLLKRRQWNEIAWRCQ